MERSSPVRCCAFQGQYTVVARRGNSRCSEFMMRRGKNNSRVPRLTVLSNLVRVRTLSVVAIDVGERRIGPSSGRLFALLLYLVFRRGDATSRRVVPELLFPQATDGQAADSLRQLLYRLRQIGVPIEADADQLSIGVEQI